MRVNKYLAMCGAGSRRAVEQIVLNGRVSVNGVAVNNLAADIRDTDIVCIDGKPIKIQTEKVYIMLNKPVGVISTVKDPFGRTTVLDIVKIPNARLYPVGRLDYNTSGLIILTNDGDLTKTLTHPSAHINKIYIATVDRDITKEELDSLSVGIKIDGVKTAAAVFKHFGKEKKKIHITIHEGRNRQIRRMFETLGIKVKTLCRISESKLTLGNLKTGEWRYIKRSQII
jgi:23S rRNA pseudouridine2605 synthase